jgi:hypothetical protein
MLPCFVTLSGSLLIQTPRFIWRYRWFAMLPCKQIDRSLRNGEVRAYMLHCNTASSQATAASKTRMNPPASSQNFVMELQQVLTRTFVAYQSQHLSCLLWPLASQPVPRSNLTSSLREYPMAFCCLLSNILAGVAAKPRRGRQ